jgi:acyl-CoA reductase-like NAD-dependent aldehyde dehydrogenase
VRSPWDGRVVGTVAVPGPAEVERAVARAQEAAPELLRLPAHVRAAALREVSDQLTARADDLASLITAESGKPLRWARIEVARAAATFGWAAEEARRWSGEAQRLDTEPGAEGRFALVRRFPHGPVLGITPFNFPLNLVAHKVAPALAVGAPIVIKPAPATPLTALALADLVAATGLPAGSMQVLTADDATSAALVGDPRLPVVSFTGSARVGALVAAAAWDKHVVLELGGNAAAVVAPDWSSPADLRFAAQRCALFGTYQAGQSCISVQRVYVPEPLLEAFLDELVVAVSALATGDPGDPATVVGPMIDEAAAVRVERWVADACARGARRPAGGRRAGTTFPPTVLVDVPADADVLREEVFGPVLVVVGVPDVDAALAAVNDSRYGLQAGIFTRDLTLAFRAHRDLEVGGVVIGDVPSVRSDQMSYGGVKDSGRGREGVRAAMTDLTVDRVMVLTGLDL